MFEIFRKKQWPKYSFDEIKKRARLLVVDDSEFPYKLLFERDGYNIDKWSDIEDLSKLETGYYDVILLDIQGVGSNESQEQGFGILKHLRTVIPTQIIIAYSNADWALKYQTFFDMADARLDKRQDYVDFKRTVDDQLRLRFTLGFYLDRIVNQLGSSIEDVHKLRRTAKDAILSKKVDKLDHYLKTIIRNKDVIQIVLDIAKAAINIASI